MKYNAVDFVKVEEEEEAEKKKMKNACYQK